MHHHLRPLIRAASESNMRNVLILDDDKKVRTVLRDILEELGCTVIEGNDGFAADAVLRETDLDLILTDIFMPNRDGIETIRKLRAENYKVPIAAMSGGSAHDGMDFLAMARALGADHVLQKPVRMEQIAAILEELTLNRS
jgi:CheY-like chemotaxis protein